MRVRKMWRAGVCVAVMMSGFLVSGAIIPEKATFEGYCVEDRWGEKLLVNGTYAYFIGDKAWKVMERYQGEMVAVATSEMRQVMNPGAGMMMSVDAVAKVKPWPNLRIKLEGVKKAVKEVAGVAMNITLENDAEEAVTFRFVPLLVVVATNLPKQPPGWRDPEQRAYWYYREGWMGEGGEQKEWACHEESARWKAEEMVKKGKGVTVEQVGGESRVVVAPAGKFEGEVSIGRELLPGQYEVYVYMGSAMSARVPVDVVAVGGR